MGKKNISDRMGQIFFFIDAFIQLWNRSFKYLLFLLLRQFHESNMFVMGLGSCFNEYFWVDKICDSPHLRA